MQILNSDERRPTIIAASAHRLTDTFRIVLPEFSSRADIEVIDKGFDEAITAINERSAIRGCDVVVGTGAHGAYLRQHLSQPVALVKVGGFDLMAALSKARLISDRIAVVMHLHISPELRRFAGLFALPLELRAYETTDDARRCIHELAQLGIKAIVGPGLIANLAYAAGLEGVLVYSTDSVRAAFEDAIAIASAKLAEKSRRAQLDSVLRHLNDGVVAVDMAGRIVTVNPAVEKLTGTAVGNTLGKAVQSVLTDLKLGQVLTRGLTDIGSVEDMSGRSIVVDRVPLFDEGVQTGAIFTLHGSSTLERAVSKLRAHSHRKSRAARYRLEDVVAESPQMKNVVKKCAVFAAHSDAAVLISGESGTGKELLAQGIHNASQRKRAPFVAINCGAFTETLLESELFGYEEGAFTGASRHGKVGLFEAANQGTLFLDEIGEMPLHLQTRLLRALQEKEITRVGGVDAVLVDVRIVAATHRDLIAMVRRGTFREDLFYRLNILQIAVPPLHQRPEDINVLGIKLVTNALRRADCDALTSTVLSAALPAMLAYAWPGNVRELENFAERLAMACLVNDKAPTRREIKTMLAEMGNPTASELPEGRSLPSERRSRDSELARDMLDACGGNHDETARRLGISRTTLWRKLRAAE
jgi:propionate catabolism operon transcriptional regulator